jgi:hypothetical protein
MEVGSSRIKCLCSFWHVKYFYYFMNPFYRGFGWLQLTADGLILNYQDLYTRQLLKVQSWTARQKVAKRENPEMLRHFTQDIWRRALG